MIVCPTKQQQERMLGNIIIRHEPRNAGKPFCMMVDEKFRLEDHLSRYYRMSPFVFLIQKRTYRVLYHSLNLKKIFGGRNLTELHKMGKSAKPHTLQDYGNLLKEHDEYDVSDDLRALLEAGFLIPDGVDPLMPLRRMQGNCEFNAPHIGLMYLLVSNQCNLRCSYCSIESLVRKPSDFVHSFMPPSVARKGIELFLTLLNDNAREPRVIYYGGEPLLNWETLLDSLTYIRELEKEGRFQHKKVDVTMVCNGTLVTEEIADTMKRLSLTAGVSIDGLRHHHDRMRIYRGGGGSWEDTLRGYFLIRNRLGNCGISCTLGPHNYNDIEEIAEFLAARLECRGLGFNILKGLPLENTIEIAPDIITAQIIKAYRIFRKYGIYEDRILRKVKAFVFEEPWLKDCGGYGGQIAICADGLVGPCHIAADDHRFCWGHVAEGGLREKILQGELTRQWCARSPITMKECSDCIGLGICGGGCAEEAYVKSGNMYDMDQNFCVHCKTLIEWLCDDLAEILKKAGSLEPVRARRISA